MPRLVRSRARLPLAVIYLHLSLFLVAAAASAGCGRTQLEPPFGKQPVVVKDAAPPDLPRDALMDLPIDLPLEAPPDLRPDVPAEHKPPACVPVDETCNGADDDCNGAIDENQPPIPCPNGGYRYCVAGRYSECPRRCDVCVPGSHRICLTSFCTFWGRQDCAPDGRSFLGCKEVTAPPPECKAVAERMMRSKDLEECCVMNGYCCLDEFDLNNNGDRDEMIGNCQGVACTP